jgi:ubiquinone/menaquinone biosynthesis C-methylase UbiE
MQPDYRLTSQKTWDAIAESFDTTRQKPWKICLDFIHSHGNTDVVADIGCGNGRHLFPCAEQCFQVVGVDISQKLLRIVGKKIPYKTFHNISLVHADAMQLPFEDNSFDAVLCIASLHNIRGRQHRRTALQEIFRILKPDGCALISVWSRWQDRYYKHFLKQYLIGSGEFGDIEIYWRQHNLNIPRFYHLYGRGEFHRELKSAGFHIVNIDRLKIQAKRFPDNYFARVRKR